MAQVLVNHFGVDCNDTNSQIEVLPSSLWLSNTFVFSFLRLLLEVSLAFLVPEECFEEYDGLGSLSKRHCLFFYFRACLSEALHMFSNCEGRGYKE